MGAELCLAHDMGGGWEAYGGPLLVDMQPYGCFIEKAMFEFLLFPTGVSSSGETNITSQAYSSIHSA